MRITFVMGHCSVRPVGGDKVVYEYANRLAARGHRVTVVHSFSWAQRTSRRHAVRMVSWRSGLGRAGLPLVDWFPVRRDVEMRLVPRLDASTVPQGDAVIATAWRTAQPVADLPASRGRKFYLVQHYETWDGAAADVDATWRLPLHKLVIARWLWEIGARLGETERMTYAPNGVDLDHFRVTTPGEQRDRLRVGMLHHHLPFKGVADGLEALDRVRERHPDLRPVLFGTHPRPAALPPWMGYVENPRPDELVRLYNSMAVFLHTSHAEGWGLPAAEAMACGAALVAAGNDGVREFAEDGVTALLAPTQNPALLADRLAKMLSDTPRRLALSRAGTERIAGFSWQNAVDTVESALLGRTRAGALVS